MNRFVLERFLMARSVFFRNLNKLQLLKESPQFLQAQKTVPGIQGNPDSVVLLPKSVLGPFDDSSIPPRILAGLERSG